MYKLNEYLDSLKHMEEYLNSIKNEIGYTCNHYTWVSNLYLEIYSDVLSNAELNRLKTILKKWSFLSAPVPLGTNAYVFLISGIEIEKEIRSYGLKELLN